MNLYEVRLPAGDVNGFDVASLWNNGVGRVKYTLPGATGYYDGYRFIGAGLDKTNVRQRDGEHSTIVIGRLAGHVELEGMTVHGAEKHAIRCGEENRRAGESPTGARSFAYTPLSLTLRDVAIEADQPPPGSVGKNGQPKYHSSVRGLFTYQTDVLFEDGKIRWKYGSEHGGYHHGAADKGVAWRRVRVESVAAEGFKIASRPEEVLWRPGWKFELDNCYFADWHQPWTWQGGVGANFQGPAGDVRVTNCEFHGGPGIKGYCLAIGDGGGRFYDATTGRENVGLANRFIVIQNNGLFSGPGTENCSVIMRIGSESHPYTGMVGRRALIQGNAVYGERMLAQLGGLTRGFTIDGCNTPAIEALAKKRGFDTTWEATVNGTEEKFSDG